MIYLDYSANTPADPAVLEAFLNAELSYPGNPNAAHPLGLASREALARATDSIAEMLQIQPSEIIYTSGASEANNLAIKGVARAQRHVGKHIISTALEHPSVSGPLSYLQEQGYEVELAEIGRDGKISLESLGELLRKDTVLVAVSAVDSELGVIQPIPGILRLLEGYPNCRLHVDATQAIGKIPFSFEGIDTVSLAAHKFYGLNGSGLLYKKQDLVLEPLIHGGSGASLYRSGTPTLALVTALETALRLALPAISERYAYVRRLNDRLRAALAAYPAVRLNSPSDAVPHILNLSVQGVRGSRFQQALAAQGVCVSVKSACSTDGTPSRAVYAVSRDRKNALSSWRISLSHLTTESEIDEFLRSFDRCIRDGDSPEAVSAGELPEKMQRTGEGTRTGDLPASLLLAPDGTPAEVEVACEHAISVFVNGRAAMKLVCTPEHLEELVLGRLLTEGLIDGIGDLRGISISAGGLQACVTLAGSSASALVKRETELISTCCTDNQVYIERRKAQKTAVKTIPWDMARFEKMLERLRRGEPLFSRTRATHACYLAKGDEVICCREDIGRHNALDKVIGYGLLHGVKLSECALITTGRIPTDMVRKAINAGIPVLVSKTYPTDRAVQAAKQAGLTLITVRENGRTLVWTRGKDG